MSIAKNLAFLVLRHYRDPTSWSGVIVAAAAAAHFTTDPQTADAIAGVCAAVVALLLTLADGRKNPNDGADGTIAPRLPTVVVAETTVVASPGPAVQPERGAAVRPADDDAAHNTPTRPGFGPYRP